MTEQSSKERYNQLVESIEPILEQIEDIVRSEFKQWQPTEQQKEDLSDRFWKWINEGMGWDYYPNLNEKFRDSDDPVEYPWFVQVMIDRYCSNDHYQLEGTFGPKGVEFE